MAEMTHTAIGLLLCADKINEVSFNARTKYFRTLLLMYHKLSAEQKNLVTEMKSKATAQATMDELHKKLFNAEERLKDCVSMPDLVDHFMEQEGQHQVELKKERDEVSRLQQHIADMEKKHKADIEGLCQEFAEERYQLMGKIKKNEDLLKYAESLVTSAQQDFNALQTKSKACQADLVRINSYLENFPEANMFALRAIKKTGLRQAILRIPVPSSLLMRIWLLFPLEQRP